MLVSLFNKNIFKKADGTKALPSGEGWAGLFTFSKGWIGLVPFGSVWVGLFGLVYLGITVALLPRYFRWDANLYLGILCIPYVSKVSVRQTSLRYLLPATISLLLAVYLPVNTLLFIALLFAALLLVESSIGKVNPAVLFLVLLISPVFYYFSHLGEFPVRLWLSSRVAAVLQDCGIAASAAGNQIQLANAEFSVDPACAGLNMLVTSLIICLFTLSFYQRKLSKQLSFSFLTMLFTATILLNIVCNFFRILLIVFFQVMPGTTMHDVVGIGCLLLYVIFPLMQLTGWYVGRFGKAGIASVNAVSPLPSYEGSRTWPLLYKKSHYTIRPLQFIINIIFVSLICYVASHTISADSRVKPVSSIQLNGYQKTILKGNIIKFENSGALIYIKPTAFYAPEHDPMVCWTGSGYQFQNIQSETVNGTSIFTGTLKKGKDKIYAAWWFDDGLIRTTNQFTWRWRAARGLSNFYIVNINATSPHDLHIRVSEMLGKHLAF